MDRIRAVALVGSLALISACSNILDVNDNPDAPQVVTANLYLPPMIHWMATSPQYDGRFVGRYTQQWTLPGASPSTWDRMGYDPSSDNAGQQWRDVYWTLGQNLVDMMEKAEAEQRWDLLGVGYILKAWGWQALTDLHGEIIVKEAIDPTRFSFDYDPQEYVYQEIQRLLGQAIEFLQRTDGAVDRAYLGQGDRMYNGDRTKWLKLAYGMLALNLNHYSNKGSYDPDAVIAAVDKSFASNDDDALLTYPKTNNDDTNFWGRTRDNITNYRQTEFAVGLMDGTQFGGVVDPRLSRMLSPSNDGEYRGLDPMVGYGALTTDQRPNPLFGPPGQSPGRYIFDDKAKIPVMTYAQLQFIKAEAALRKGNQALAGEAYRKAVAAHIDFVNARNRDNNQAPMQITDTEKAAFLAAPEIVPATLTLSHVMSQKFIALYGWGHNDLWLDMRRYHYTAIDPVSGTQVFRGFTPPTNLYGDNSGKLVQRIRPRYNSEYVWNRPGLDKIGGLASDYHTVPIWITQP
jgi:hypothetical protein